MTAGNRFQAWPFFAEDEIEAAVRVLKSGRVNYWTGDEARLFEKEFAAFHGCGYGVAVANGTVALELALYALGLGPGDEVIVTARSFFASAGCILSRGARPVFADVDPDSQNITAETIRPALTAATKAVITVHLAGWPCDMDPILELAYAHGLKIIEDCAQAHGARYKGRPVGSLGHVGAFSFCQDKIMTTGGEGGLLTTSDPAIRDRAWSYKDHGRRADAVDNHGKNNGFQYIHDSLGTNWRLTEMQAAIGRAQLKKLPGWLETRQAHAATLNERLGRIDGLRIAVPPDHISHARYKYYVFVRPERLKSGWTRDRIMAEIAGEGIPCGTGSCPEIYLEKAFDIKYRPDRALKVARELGGTSLMFPVHPTLTEADIHRAADIVEKVMARAVR